MAAARLGVTNGTVLDQKCDILLIPDLVLGEGEAMRRREFIALIGAVACPLSARAQQTGVPIVGVLGTVAQPAWTKLVAAFEQQLRERGWIDGRTITIIYRWAEGRSERFAEIAAEFVSRKVDVIVTGGNAVSAVRQATSTIPIVFALAVDPVGSGFVNSLSRHGGNVTGLSLQGPDLAGKRLELLQEVAPGRGRLAILVNAGYPAAKEELAQVQTAARALGLESVVLEIRRAEDIAAAFEGVNDRADALYVIGEALVNANIVQITRLALNARLPTVSSSGGYVEAGCLMSYGAILSDLFRRAGDYVDKILHGAKPADLPVEQPTKFELLINLRTAKALGLTVPQTLITRADELIE
jgi:putative ABC transport system substrate-binding protein